MFKYDESTGLPEDRMVLWFAVGSVWFKDCAGLRIIFADVVICGGGGCNTDVEGLGG